MRLITWNMAAGFGYNPSKHERAWRWLQDLGADVALLQEAVVPEWAAETWQSVIHAPRYNKRTSWGCAILSLTDDLTEYRPADDEPWLQHLRGAVIAAQPTNPAGLWFSSIHSSASPITAENLAKGDHSAIHRCHPPKIWEIEAIAPELSRRFLGQRFVAGGDLNSSMHFDTTRHYDYNERLFANLAAMGFVDTRPRHSPDEQQTFFKAGNDPFQLDHLYTDAQTERTVTDWRVIPGVAGDGLLSDHAPVEITIG